MVAQHLRSWIAYSGAPLELSYWRTRTGIEVDFVVYGNTDFFALEVKNTDRVRPDDLRGLRAFMGEYPECRPMLLYRGTEKLEIGGIPCWPVAEFLARLRPGVDAIPRSNA